MNVETFVFVTFLLASETSCKDVVHVTSENMENYFEFFYYTYMPGIGNYEKDIDTISEDAFRGVADIEYIYLKGCMRLTELPERLFQKKGLQIVKVIFFRYNGIRRLPENIFHGMILVTYIAIVGNRLETLPANLFASNINLGSLDLQYNELISLPPRLFARNTNLRILLLRHNKLKSLSPQLITNYLQTVDLSHNKFKSLSPQLFTGATRITDIRMSDNKLTSLPPQLFSTLTNLSEIDFSRNRLTSLPPQLFKKNTLLSYINFHGNKLEAVPDRMFVSKITRLDLSDNKLTYIQDDVFQSSNIPESINGEVVTTEIDVSNNYLLCISSSFLNIIKSSEDLVFKVNNNCLDPSTILKLKCREQRDCDRQDPGKCSCEMIRDVNAGNCIKKFD